ncbi:ribosomal biogenesis factor-like [Suricata suricatta]|uniref:ribosomal biogenesis factor-like n=1 Tax=Suricata suricatta TaxID=37032 RepID=UPI001155B420|nr:ribosomal biogenesis factor-like [Suricata suricatta]
MAKKKPRGRKSRNVSHITNQRNCKTKNKAKPVATNLKKTQQQQKQSEPVNVDETTRLMTQVKYEKHKLY